MPKNVYIQGIYSTAISRLFLDKGFELAFPSKTIAKRLGLEKFSSQWSAALISNPTPFGLKLFGDSIVVKEILQIIKEELDPVVIRKSKINLGLTALAEVIEESDKRSKVDIGTIQGYIWGRFPVGSKLLVSVREPIFEDDIVFSPGVCASGKYSMLVQNGDVVIPKHILNNWKGKKLLSLAKETLLPGWGAVFFETCINSDEKEIKDELEQLLAKCKTLLENKTESKGVLHEGIEYCEIYLSYESKSKLDEIRNKVIPTVKGHHYLRSWGEGMNTLIHFAENLLSHGIDKIEENLYESIFTEVFKVGKLMNIFHFKPNGRLIKLSPGKIIASDPKDKSVTLMRNLKGTGVYDGLEAKKEIGDYAVATYKLGSMVTRTHYYRKGGELIGIYSNFSTPIEIYPNAISYIDLEVDMVKKSSGEIKILDRDKLEDIVVKEIISEKLYWRLLELIENEKKELANI
ncbi:MAG TPA: DUF402 domain-containing protein [Geobacterales bacterium]|nr:DUF402 domain-containing protein [Geobacterales bacterium]